MGTKTLKHFLITSGGTAVNGLLGLLFYIVIARALGPASYGILAVAIAVITLLADVADFGVDTALLNFVSKYRHQEQNKTLKFIKLGLEIKILVWLVILLLGWFLTPWVASSLFLKPQLVGPLHLSLIGMGGAMIFSLATHVVQAYEKFWLWSFINIGLNSVRLLAVAVLIFTGTISLTSTLWVYLIFPFAGFFGAAIFLPNFLKAKKELEISQEFFHYSKWVALIGILAATSGRLDTFISTRLLSVDQVGLYSAAVQLSAVLPQLVFALATVVAPKLASLDSNEKAITYLKKTQLLVTAMFFVGALLSPLSIFIIPAIYGTAYTASVTPFIILFFAQLIFLLSLPTHQAIYYYFSKPNVISLVTVGQLVITGVAGWFLISSFGILGAALTALVNNLFGLIFPGLWVIYQFKRSLRPSV